MKYRWVICGLLFLATFLNYFDRQILALLKPILDDQFKWSESDYGRITAAFQAFYSIGLLAFGWFVDRFGVRIGYTVSIFAWSLAAMGHALVTSIFGFGVARAALGLGEGGNFPCCIKTVANWFPAAQRAFATSVFNAGSNMGALVAPAVVPVLAIHYGWRSPFIFAGILGLLWIGLWIPFFREPRQAEQNPEQREENQHEEGERKIGWTGLFRFPQLWAFTVAKLITDPIWWFYLSWLPDYFKTSRGIDMAHSGNYLVSIYTIVTVLSILGCWFAGKLIHTLGLTAGRKSAMLLFACLVLPVYFTGQASDWGAVCLIGLAGAAHQAWSANLYSAVSD
jgi:ACS family hexuronate transporter-like MFS transporter